MEREPSRRDNLPQPLTPRLLAVMHMNNACQTALTERCSVTTPAARHTSCVPAAAILASLLTCIGSTAHAQAPVTDPTRLEARVTQLERSLSGGSSLLQMHQTLQRLEREVRELRGDIELQAHEMQQLQQRQRDLYLDVDKRLQALENATASTPPATATPPAANTTTPGAAAAPPADVPLPPPQPPSSAVATADPAAEQQAYRKAFDLLKSGKFGEASAALTQFLKEYPNGRFADNAQYWLGESHYVSREFGPALAAFEQLLVDYPDSPKRSHAMLKIGFIHDEQGRKDQARQVLRELVETYPQSTAAGLAAKRLKRLQ